MPKSVNAIMYEVECENDPVFAGSAAHKVIITDTLAADKFVLPSLATSQVEIGGKILGVDNKQNFVSTLDLRPEINALAQVEQKFDTTTGVLTLTMTAINPITLEEIADPMVGVLLINTNGLGEAKITYNVNLRDELSDGNSVTNRAEIIFDQEASLLTPVWTNVIDKTPPVSRIAYGETQGDSVLMYFDGSDNLSGLWRYNVYTRFDSLDYWRMAEEKHEGHVFISSREGNNRQFYIEAVDSAGNVEEKNPQCEYDVMNGVSGIVPTLYDISFRNFDGSDIKSMSVPSGIRPVYMGQTPQRSASNHCTYQFIGWSPAIVPAVANAIYTAMYDSVMNRYEIVFLNCKGDTIQKDSVSYGERPSFYGNVPYKNSNDSMAFTFREWYPSLADVTGNASYEPLYDSVAIEEAGIYHMVFRNWNGETVEEQDVFYGQYPDADRINVYRAEDDSCTYQFNGWNPVVMPATQDAEYTACFVPIRKRFNVRYVNFNGYELQSEELEYGMVPTYNGKNPSRPNNLEYSYRFVGWDKVLNPVTSDVAFTAVFDSVVIKYSVAFCNFDGTILYSDSLSYGAIPVYQGSVPTRTTTEQYSYVFTHWNDSIKPISGKTVFIAMYDSLLNQYSVTVNAVNGEVYGSGVYYYGDTAVLIAVPHDDCDFVGWSNGEVSDTIEIEVSKDSTLTAFFRHVPYHFSDSVVICQGDFYDWHNNRYSVAGVYCDSLKAAYNVDSIYKLILTVNPTYLFEESDTICQGETYYWHNRTLTWPGIYYDSLLTSNGCDSVYKLTLTVNSSYMMGTEVSICQGDTYSWRGNTYFDSGVYYDSLQTLLGCDSIYKLTLTVNPTYFIEDIVTICQNDDFQWRGNTYSKSGIYYDSLQTLIGCDSVYKLTLTVYPTYLVNDTATLPSDGSGYLWRGQSYSEAGDYTDSYKTVSGCDSVYTLHLMDSISTEVDEVSGMNAVKVYVVPNPVRPGMVAHIYGEFGEVETVEILNNFGQVVDRFTPNSYPIEIDGFEVDGLYYVRIITRSGEIFTEKLLVE